MYLFFKFQDPFQGTQYNVLAAQFPYNSDVHIPICLPINTDLGSSDVLIKENGCNYVILQLSRRFIKSRDFYLKKNATEKAVIIPWLDKRNYLRPTEVCSWFRRVLRKALKQLLISSNMRAIKIDDTIYTLHLDDIFIDNVKTFSCYTVFVKILNKESNYVKFRLIPVIKLPESRWPISTIYREIPEQCRKGYWTLRPRTHEISYLPSDYIISWPITLHEQEYELYTTEHQIRVSRIVSENIIPLYLY